MHGHISVKRIAIGLQDRVSCQISCHKISCQQTFSIYDHARTDRQPENRMPLAPF